MLTHVSVCYSFLVYLPTACPNQPSTSSHAVLLLVRWHLKNHQYYLQKTGAICRMGKLSQGLFLSNYSFELIGLFHKFSFIFKYISGSVLFIHILFTIFVDQNNGLVLLHIPFTFLLFNFWIHWFHYCFSVSIYLKKTLIGCLIAYSIVTAWPAIGELKG